MRLNPRRAIFGTEGMYKQLHDFLYMYNKPAIHFMYKWNKDDGRVTDSRPIAKFPSYVDAWLLVHCPFEWVIRDLRKQYGAKDRLSATIEQLSPLSGTRIPLGGTSYTVLR